VKWQGQCWLGTCIRVIKDVVLTFECESKAKVAIIGECMVELSQQPTGQFKMGYGGDTLNTAVYLSRCGGAVDYFTVLGDDSYSQSMLHQWQNEGIGIEQVKISKGKMPGLYIINNDERGERFFHYWRDNAAAKLLLCDYPEVFKQLSVYPYVFLSGITLSLYLEKDLTQLFAFLAHYRANGGIVVFDNNYRQRNWPSVDKAISVFAQMMHHTDIALLSLDDEVSMYGEHSAKDCVERWSKQGVAEVLVKNGQEGCLYYHDGKNQSFPLSKVLKAVDTTAAGDSFNGAYLAARLAGESATVCIESGQKCASVVIMHKGAIIDPNINLEETPL
jgi:2-dehydro-3-deoxygluconokinase